MKKQSIDFVNNLIEIATKAISRADNAVYKRCMLEGCRYGIGLPGEKPKKNCIYCKQPNQGFWGTGEAEVLKSLYKTLSKNKIAKKVIIEELEMPTRICNGLRKYGIRYVHELRMLERGEELVVERLVWDRELQERVKSGQPMNINALEDLGRVCTNIGPASVRVIKESLEKSNL